METSNAGDQQVAIIQNSIEIFKTAPQVLIANRERTNKALAVGNKIISEWDAAWKIEDEDARMAALAGIDQRSNKYVVNCSTALTEEKQLRSAITQLMDNFKGMFTEAENVIDKAKAGTPPNTVQQHRNKYATELKKITDRKQKEAQDKADKANEKISLLSEIEKRIFTKYNEILTAKKTTRLNYFNAITLENFDEREGKIKAASNVFAEAEIAQLTISMFAKYHNIDEVTGFINSVKETKLTEFKSNYLAELTLQQEELVDLLPSKKAELVEIKRVADEAEDLRKKTEAENDKKKKKLLEEQQQKLDAEKKQQEADKKKREEEQQQKITSEAATAQAAEETKIDVKAQGEQTMVMFDKEQEIANNAPTIKTKDVFEITVLHPVGFTQIFALWFEHEGKNLGIDKIGNTKLDQMKAWCEKQASGEKALKIESKFIQYDNVTKAVSRKEKAVKV